MKIKALKQRLARDRPMIRVTLRMPEDVVEDLKRRGVSDEVIDEALSEVVHPI